MVIYKLLRLTGLGFHISQAFV
uniref:Uncharacterized protein n=1 Tax=Anguilla anguilla TaxID=7936 RepID=A0A0E9RJL7_ANGAN